MSEFNQLLYALEDAREELARAVRTRRWFIGLWVTMAAVVVVGFAVMAVFDPESNAGGSGLVVAILAGAVLMFSAFLYADDHAGDVAMYRRALKKAERAHQDYTGPVT